MYLTPKQLIISICFLILFPSKTFGESSFDFFFKTAAQYQDVVIQEVLSSDTVVLKEKTGEKGEVIKLIGLRAPKSPRRKAVDIERDQYGFTKREEVSPLTSVEEKAFDFVSDLLTGQHVRIEFDTEKKSEDHATLAYVFLLKDNTFVNTEILRHGFADLRIRPPNTKYATKLREAYKEARAEKRGLQGE